MFINQVTIMGNLTRQPELKSLPSGEKMCGLSIAVNSKWTDKNTGEKKESTEFISVLAFGKTAELCAQYLEKGQQVYVQGKIKNRVEKTDEGNRYHTGIVAEKVQFGSKPGNSPHSTNSVEKSRGGASTPRTEGAKRTIGNTGMDYPDDDINAEDIPF